MDIRIIQTGELTEVHAAGRLDGHWSATLGNALEDGGLRGFLRAQALALLLFAGLRTLYLLLDPQAPALALLIGVLLPGGIAASFLFLRSRL